MTKLKELEKAGRTAWLATIGTYAKGWEIISGKVNETFEDTNQLINELVENGEKVETELKEKLNQNTLLDERISKLKAQLGLETSFDDKVAQLSKKVDSLTVEVEKLIAAKASSGKKEVIAEPKAPAKTARAKRAPATKTTKPKATTTRKPRATKAAPTAKKEAVPAPKK